jgi:RNA polymerase sigma factor (TIGR02999 family)
LVHEAFLKLAGGQPHSWHDSRHFFNAAAEVMRQILVSHHRSRSARKRGGSARRIALDWVEPVTDRADEDAPDWEALDRALDELRQIDERRHQVVMLRYFAGLTDAQVAESLGISEKTAERDWATAKVFLRARMVECLDARPRGEDSRSKKPMT